MIGARATGMDMSLIPVSRKEMREAKAKNDYAIRVHLIDSIVSQIYAPAVRQAKTLDLRSYTYPLGDTTYHNNGLHTSEAVNAVIPDIISRLQELFPGCTVSFVNIQMQDYIVIDWS